MDHINGNPLDNRRSNLRICSAQGNQRNRRKPKGRSGLKGVSWDSERKKWIAECYVDKRCVLKRRFNSKIEAAKAYDDAASRWFGAFACTNKAMGRLEER